MKLIYSIIAVLLVSQSAFSEDSVLFPVRARVNIAGNMLVPGYFCDGMHHTGWPWMPLDYGFAFGDGAPTNSTFIGCCGVHPNNTGPTLNRNVGAGRYGAKVWLEFEGQICNTGLSLLDVPNCFDSFINGFKSSSAYSAWEYSSRPDEYDWVVEFRRNTNSTPVAEWQTADDTGIATGSSSRHYSLVADGVSSAVVSKVNVLEQPTYEFVGDPLGCTLLTNGTLIAGTNAGTVHIATVITSTNICFERDFYFELKDKECETCQQACPIGNVDAHNSSVDVKVSLGSSSSPLGKAFVQVKAETPSVTLGTPAAL